MPVREYDYSMLRGRIREKLGTEGEFASKIGRSANYVSSVFRNKTYFSQKDILLGADALEIDMCDIGAYFFTLKVHKSET